MAELLQLQFLRPWWLLCGPLVLVLAWWLLHKARQHSRWSRLLPHSIAGLLLSQPPQRQRGRWLLLGCGWLLAVLALAGPALPDSRSPMLRADGHALVIVLDLSRAMLATDIKPDRLQRAQRKITDLLQQPDLEVGLIAFAGSAHRVAPLTTDAETLHNLLRALHPQIMPMDGQALEAALTMSRQMIAERPPRQSSILLITSGAEGAVLAELERQAAELGPRLSVLGVGSAEGSPVALADGGFLRDSQGRILLPRLDGKQLASTLRRQGARYSGLTLDDSDLEHLLPAVRAQPGRMDSANLSHLREQSHWLILLLLPLAAMTARRGWLGILAGVLLVPVPAEAMRLADLWQRPDQQAMQLLEDNPADAARRFEDLHWQAWAWYQAGDLQKAIESYQKLVNSDPDNADLHADLGTALAMAGHYQLALESFEQALTRSPDLRIARHNRSRVEAWLEALQREQAQESSEPDSQSQQLPAALEGDASNSGDATPPGDNSAESNDTQGDNNASTGTSSGQNDEAATLSVGGTAQEDPLQGGEPQAGQAIAERLQRERQQALQQWLERIEDDPAELLRRKFLYQHLEQQE